MKKYIPIILPAFILFISCATSTSVSYIGASYATAPDKEIDIFVDPDAISRSYTVVGRGYPSTYSSKKEIQRHAIAQARKHGADAILFTDRIYLTPETSIHTTNSFDTSGNKTRSSTIAGPVVRAELEISFLKYK